MNTPTEVHPARSQRGSALLVVLLMLGTIGALAAVVARSVTGAAVELSAARLAAQDASDLRAGIELGVVAIHKLGKAMRVADASLALPDRRIVVRVINERGRIDINAADPALLSALLQANGVIEDEAAAMARNVVEWRGGSASLTLTAPAEEEPRLFRFANPRGSDPRPDSELRKAPAQVVGTRFFFHPMQLASVPGFSKALVARVLPLVTVATGSRQIDPYVAYRGVLAALPGVSPATVDAFLSARHGDHGRELAIKLLGVPETLVTSNASSGWRIQITSVGNTGRTYRGEAVVAALDGDTEPYRVLYALDGQ